MKNSMIAPNNNHVMIGNQQYGMAGVSKTPDTLVNYRNAGPSNYNTVNPMSNRIDNSPNRLGDVTGKVGGPLQAAAHQ
jgi:hypothetical protein